jgi:RNA methyltransferase, TrmH family
VRALARDTSERRREGLVVVEGPRALAAAVETPGIRVHELYVGTAARARWSDVIGRAVGRGAEIVEVDDAAMERLGDARSGQGLLALVAHQPARLATLLDAVQRDEHAFVLVVDEIGDPGNAGTIVRAAEAFAATGIVLGPNSVDAYNPKAVRASAGTCFATTIVEASVEQVTTAQVLEALGAGGVRRYAARADAASALADLDFTGRTAIVVGHETRGLAQGLPFDAEFSIPTPGTAESLNLAMAASICAYAVSAARAGRP